jgi:carbon-monoxide dehydrogenase large subunit
VLNPMIVRGQIHGGVIQGIGQALVEHAVYDRASGQMLSATFMDYAMPRADLVPEINTELEEVPSVTNPVGVKGIGESGTIGAPPSVINAIIDALDMPATPARVWQAIQNGRAAKMAAE